MLYSGDSRYRLFDTFTQGLIQGFNRESWQVLEADLSANWNDTLSQALNDKPSFTLSLNGIRASLDVQGRSWHDVASVPLVVMLLDHPLYHLDVFEEPIENMVFLTIDPQHAFFINRYLEDKRKAVFFPHGGMKASEARTQRDIDVLFAGSLEDPKALLKNIDFLPHELKAIAEAIVHHMTLNTGASLMDAMKEANLPKTRERCHDFMSALTLADRYVRHSRRYALIKALASKVGLTAYGWGEGWQRLQKECSSLNFNGDVSTQEICQLMTRAKITANALPGFTEGSHERVLSAMRNGSLCLTDHSQWLKNSFHESLLFYSWDDLGTMVDQVKELLANKSKREKMTKIGQNLVENQHGWEHRAQLLTRMFSSHS